MEHEPSILLSGILRTFLLVFQSLILHFKIRMRLRLGSRMAQLAEASRTGANRHGIGDERREDNALMSNLWTLHAGILKNLEIPSESTTFNHHPDLLDTFKSLFIRIIHE